MVQIGKRIIFDKTTGKVLADFGEMQGDNILPRETIGELDYVDLSYGQDRDKFMRVKSYHINPDTKEVIFDELFDSIPTPEQQIAELQQQLLQAQGVV